MKHIWIITAIALAFVSCAKTTGNITGYTKDGHAIGTFSVYTAVYGKHNAEIIPFGVRHSANMDIGFKALCQMIGTLAAAIYYGEAQLALQTTAQLKAAGLTQEHITKLNNDLTASLSKDGLAKTQSAAAAGLFTPTQYKQ